MTAGPAEAPAPAVAVDARAFRRMMARWATGVAVVTTRERDRDFGLTVNAFLSVSLVPPQVLVSLARDADTTPAVRRSGVFAVNVLTADQRPISERFARQISVEEKFRDLPVKRGATGAPLLAGTLGGIECRLRREYPVSDHFLLLGEVISVEAGTDGLPLLFFHSRYSEPHPPDRVRLPPAPA
jgi:3-hydroxy-9,10-secoandrosta-1,3,5(10)-triene-9,17-dione monooxygenase reductase component